MGMDGKKTLKKLSKLELLAEQEREIQELKQQLEEKNKVIEQRTLRVKQFGNIAQAALALNEVFESAQRAADQYLESVKSGIEDRLQRDGTILYVSETEAEGDHALEPVESNDQNASEAQPEFAVDEILRSIYEYEVVDECAGSMKRSKKVSKEKRGKHA